MNFHIHRSWFHEKVDCVEEWAFPARGALGGVHRSSPRVHNLGCWALYRILGRDYP